MQDYRSTLHKVISLYRQGGFKIKTISSNIEFIPVPEAMKDEYNFIPNYTSAQEHVPEAERNNRVIKERVSTVFHSLPYMALPRLMIKYLAMEVTKKLNYFPTKGGISKYFSPREILHKEKLDYVKHCMIPQFSYVLAHEEPQPSNTQVPRALGCIYLRPITNSQGGHELFHLGSGQIITRRRITQQPITDQVIRLVQQLVINNGIKSLKIETKQDIYFMTPAGLQEWIISKNKETTLSMKKWNVLMELTPMKF